MNACQRIELPARAVIRLEGAEAKSFLNGLISNDTGRIGPERAIYAALLTPQGKFLHDLMLAEQGDGALLLETEAARAPELLKKLTMYRLRAKVSFTPLEGWKVFALIGPEAPQALTLAAAPGTAKAFQSGVAFIDPRLAALGARILLPPGEAIALGEPAGFDDYDRLRISLGVPDGARDIEIDKGLLMENHFEALNGVDFRKGCYVGQELTARTKHRGLVKKKLYRVHALDGAAALPGPDTPITLDGAEAGILRSASGTEGLALLRIEAVEKAAGGMGRLEAGGVALEARAPAYMLPG